MTELGEVRPSKGPTGPAYLGLGLVGWGLAILLRVAPHEDPIVGAGLLALGVGLLATARRLPRVDSLPAWPVAGLGAFAAAGILAYDALFDAPLNLTKAAILVWGLLLVVLAPFLDRSVRLPTREPTQVSVATIVAYLIPALGFPFAVWILQATFESLVGATPVEAFVEYALLVPLSLVLQLLGWHPVVDGQVIAYATPNGPLRVEVGAACSGVQAMALFGGVLALFLFVERPTGRRLALWTTIGLLGVYIANLVRLVALTVVGYHSGRDALLAVHEQAGWVFFVAWALLFSVLVRRSSERTVVRTPPMPRTQRGRPAEPSGAANES